jgi:hypothetical protein
MTGLGQDREPPECSFKRSRTGRNAGATRLSPVHRNDELQSRMRGRKARNFYIY